MVRPAFLHDTEVPTTSEAPVQSAEAVTPDNDDIVGPYRALWIGVTGNVAVLHVRDEDPVTYTNVPVGWFPWAVKKVMATGTTATGIIGMS